MNCSRFYILTDHYRSGDATTNRLVAYANALVEKGVDVEIVPISSSIIRINTLSDKVNVNFLIQHHRFRNKIVRFAYVCHLLRKFCKKIGENDIVYVYNSMNYLPIILKYKKDKVFHERTECPLLDKIIYSKLYYYNLCKSVTGLFVISQSLKGFFIEKGVNADNIHIINMVVDPARFNGLIKNPDKTKYVFYCGSVGNAKDGVDCLLRVFWKYSQIYSDRKLLIAGRIVEKNAYEQYLNFILSHNIEDKVKFLGLVTEDRIPQLIVDAEMLILTRPDNVQAKYGFPTKLGEYLLSKNPVVITRVGEIERFLVDKQSAFIAEPDNDDILKAMCYVSQNPQFASEVGNNGYNVAIKYFNSTNEIDKILNIVNV